jgi:hypothetical protein
MKKYIVAITVLAFAVMMIASCKKSFFDAPAQDGRIDDASAFKTKADFDAALIGAYTSLQGGNAAGERWVSVPGWVSQDMVDVTEAPKPISGYMTPANSDFQNIWREYYKIVGSANIVLDKLAIAPEGILTAADVTSMSAQAKFLRGFAYLSLARAFGDVPMPLTSYTPEQNSISCTPKQDVFSQVVSDLTEAAANLPEAGEWGQADIGRATKGGALAYLAYAYMYKEDWANAAKAIEDLMALTNPKYELAQSVRTPFSVKNKNTPEYNKENIFEVQYREKAGDNFQWGSTPNTGHLLAGLFGPRNIGNEWSSWGGWGEFLINRKAVDSYETGDERRQELIKLNGETYKGELMADTLTAPGWALNIQKTAGFAAKYWLGNDGGSLSPQNLPQMRFAEVLLNYAEVLFRQNKPVEAYAQLNKVRARAKLDDKPVSSDEQTFLSDLMDERRHELLMEPNLWFHYTRTGTAAKFYQENYNINMQPQWVHFPIPERERTTNPNLCNNGY